MKVDVGGYEMNVLKDADSFLKNGNIKILQLEFGHTARAGQILLKDIYDYLFNFGYKGYIVIPKG